MVTTAMLVASNKQDMPSALLLPAGDAHKQLVPPAAAMIADSLNNNNNNTITDEPGLETIVAVASSTTCNAENQQPEPEDDDMADASGTQTLPASTAATAFASVPALTPATITLPQLESDEQQKNDSDWRTSSCTESPARFSLIDLPAKVRASFFPRKPRKLKRKKPRDSDRNGDDSASQDVHGGGDSTSSNKLTLTSQPSLPAEATATTSEPDKSVETFKHFWDERLRSTMEKLASLSKHDATATSSSSSSSTDNDADATRAIFHLLLKLYAHQDVVAELYSSAESHADALEFYIPQLCTFLLHGNYAKQHQLECFLLSRSGEALPFAHRLTWFVRSFCDDARRYKSEYLSVVTASAEGASDLLTAIEQRAGVPALLMHNGLCNEEVSSAQPSNLLRRRSSIFAIDDEMDPRVLETDESFAGALQLTRDRVVYAARPHEGSSQQTSLYKQTPDFVTALTDLAHRLIAVPFAQRSSALRAGLTDLQHEVLPSDVLYLPVGNTHHRVKAIHVDECFAFSTKERVPCFLVFEVLEYSACGDESESMTVSPTASTKAAAAKAKAKAKAKRSKKPQRTAVVAATTTTPAPVATPPAANRPPPRGFALMLPFLKSSHVAESSSSAAAPVAAASSTPAANGHTSDSSGLSESTPTPRMSERTTDCTDSSCALSIVDAADQAAQLNAHADGDATAVPSPPLQTATVSTGAPLAEKATVAPTASTATASFAPAFLGYLLGTNKKAAAPVTRKPQRADIKDLEEAGALPLTPRDELDGGEDGDDEKEDDASLVASAAENAEAQQRARAAESAALRAAEVEAAALLEQATEAQKARMGQWSLPRAGRRTARSNSSARPSSQFDTFYSSWFAKKQKHDDALDAAASQPETALAVAPVTGVSAVVDGESPELPAAAAPVQPSLSAEPAAAAAVDSAAVVDVTTLFESNTVAPPSPTLPTVDDNDTSQDEGGAPRKRDRDLSMSLDFTDSNAWRVKFDLEDALTDNEPDATDSDEHDDDATAIDATVDSQQVAVDRTDDDDKTGDDDAEADDEAPIIVFRERWSEKEARLRKTSAFRDHPGWRLLSVIVKSNDDLRQEQFAAQLIAQCDRIFKQYALPLRLRPYNVIATSATTGLIEAVPDTVSLDSLKRNDPDYTTLLDFYTRLHGDKESVSFARARRNFVESLAAYSIVCYVLQIKDRHNGNILVDTMGHVVHIDFGFLLTNSPGSNLNFERAPFKLTDEFVELMGGPRSSTFRYFRSLCIRAFLALQQSMEQLVLLVEMMLVGNADLPCFAGGKRAVVDGLRARLRPGERSSACQLFVNQLIDQSINNWRTRWYDKYQRACLGIL